MIVGVDVSSHQINLAWLDNGKPQRWHQELAKGHLIDRLRSIRIEWPIVTINGVMHEATDVAIEYPFGRGNAIAALMATTGIITRQAPPWARVAWPSSGELRAAIGAKNTKESAHERIKNGCAELPTMWNADWSEHELDALVAAVGWQRILEAQDA